MCLRFWVCYVLCLCDGRNLYVPLISHTYGHPSSLTVTKRNHSSPYSPIMITIHHPSLAIINVPSISPLRRLGIRIRPTFFYTVGAYVFSAASVIIGRLVIG